MMAQPRLFVLAAAAATVLGGCSTQPPKVAITQPILTVQATSSAKDRVVGSTYMDLRTYIKDEDDQLKEVTGADCTLSSRDLRASLETPRLLRLPAYAQGARYEDRGMPAPIEVTCKAPGLRGATTITAAPGSGHRNSGTTTYSNGVSVTTMPLTGNRSSISPWTYGSSTMVILSP